MICEILAVSAENTRNELSQKPAAITNLKQVELEKWKFWVLSEFYRLSTVATKLFGFILIFCEKSSPKCLLACCPVLLVTTAKTGSIERGRFTELGPWSAYDGDWVGAEHGGELLLEPSCCFLQNRTMAFIGNCDKSGGFQVSVLNWIVLISADFVICLESNLVHLSKFEGS